MKKLFRTFALLLAGLLAFSLIVGCGSGEDEEIETPPAYFVSATPPGGVIAVNSTITVTFDNPPIDVIASTGTVTVTGKKAAIAGPFPLGPLTLTITWADGTQALNYTITGPDCCGGIRVAGGTVKDGDKDVDPEALNTDGKIEIELTENGTGNIALQTEGGDDVGWIGKVDGTKGTLELVKGRELSHEMTYVIVAKVSDAIGNEYTFKITFVTKAKE